MLRDELQPDAAAVLVDLLHEHVDDVAAIHHVLDVSDATGADVRHVQQPVRALLELDERTEVGRLHDPAGVRVPTSGDFVRAWIAEIAASPFVPSVE